ncbi:hypothetical protein EJ08DRAFT_654499 [Tothia fuscella]|uniref:Uncharacterized protein n=1 Tax=Tothia fuscella TaxID=1048955 RepID=A0A9P4NEI4_9PEZI|nr:hypothetical protein EJ08DRAFT_654499 [Tothia fuscella]
MSRDHKSDGFLPSYEESVTGDSTYTDSRPGGQRLLDQLIIVRAQHIRSVVDDQITPLIERRAKLGISKTIITLIPSNIFVANRSEFTSDSKLEAATNSNVEIIGLASEEDEDIEQVHLEGDLNRFEFWRQKDVVEELQHVLEDRLSTSPVFYGKSKVAFGTTPNVTSPVLPPPKAARGFFGRKTTKSSSSQCPAPAIAQPSTRDHLITIKVELSDMCLRTLSGFGLYETISRPALVVRVNVGR